LNVTRMNLLTNAARCTDDTDEMVIKSCQSGFPEDWINECYNWSPTNNLNESDNEKNA
jgi:hypothetical protein